jgi:aminobenzoyl-glutamate utilization protein A
MTAINVIELRRDLHQHPELGLTEFRTASIVVQTLQNLGYRVEYGANTMDAKYSLGVPPKAVLENAKQRAIRDGADPAIVEKMDGGLTGVVATLQGKQPGPTIGFRFDMDALPIEESTNDTHLPVSSGFRSSYEGNMHACAHDGHTAIGLKLAEVLSDGNFSGTVKMFFQPSEEGLNGAYPMVKKGVADDVDKMFCLHLGMGVPLGEVVGGLEGFLAMTRLQVEFRGVPSHAGASPEEGRNALLGAATALLNIHAISRFGTADTRVNVGILQGGTAANIIPYHAKMLVEMRSEVAEVNLELRRRVEQIIASSADMHGLEYDITVVGESTTMKCDDELIDIVLEEAKEVEGFQTFTRRGSAGGSEDATYFTRRVQELGGLATYILVGSPIPAPHHNEKFDIDERSLILAVNLFTRIARRVLR